MLVTILFVLLFAVILFAILFVGAVISQKSTLIYVLSVVLMPILLVCTALLYLWIVKYFSDAKFAQTIAGWGTLIFGLLYLGFISHSFSHKHETKSGKADKRYQDNPQTAPELGVYLVLTLVLAIAESFIVYKMDWF